jgi:small subunit ribosomal protein S16
MVKIRLRRMGAKKQPTYRFVVADSSSPRDGRFIEILGHYNPRTNPKTIVIDDEKAKAWLAKGAQPSEPVRRILAARGLVDRGYVPAKKVDPAAAAAAAEHVAPAAAAPAAEEPVAETAAE